MKKFWKPQWKRRFNIPLHSKSVPGDKMVKGVYEDLGTVKQQMAVLEQQAKEAVERLHRVTEKYEQLQSAHQSLLKSAGEAWQICNTALIKGLQSAQESVGSLNSTLEEQGLHHFEPLLAVPVDAGTCRIVGDIPSSKRESGLVARILAPGLRSDDGRVIVRALVLQSIGTLKVNNTEPEDTNPPGIDGA